jgi:acyl-CoA hydrolase
MTTCKLVMPGDMNHYGFLFGGKMLMWVDEVACFLPRFRTARGLANAVSIAAY